MVSIRKVEVSTTYTGTPTKMGKWINYKGYRVNVGQAVYELLKKDKTLKGKDFTWRYAKKKRKLRKIGISI